MDLRFIHYSGSPTRIGYGTQINTEIDYFFIKIPQSVKN